MPLALTLTAAPANPNHGDKITVTYNVTGEPSPAPLLISGTAVVDGVTLQATSTVSLSNTEQFNAPTAPGVTFAPTADPHVWTGIAP